MKLNRKILLITISILFVALLISSIVTIVNFRKNYTEALITGSYGLGYSLNSIVTELLNLGLPIDSFSGMDKKCRQMTEQNPHISYVGIYDLGGKALYHGDQSLIGKVFTDAVMKKSLTATKPVTQYYRRFDGHEYYDVTIPVFNGENIREGLIRLGFRTSVINDKVVSAIVQVVINFSGSFILIAVLINYFMSRFVSRPVITLSAHAGEIAAGNYDAKALVTGSDEITLLADSLNQMSSTIKDQMKSLEKSRNELEVLVDKRTVELKIANEGLRDELIVRRKAEEALAAEKERLAVTLRSIGDAVIVTDIEGTITLMNRVAEELTGWANEEVGGMPLPSVFNIINETTKERCENPVEKVLLSGHIVGLANHTALLRKDGLEIIIADSAAPIRDKESRIIGAVLVFRDITAQNKMENEMRKMQKLESLSLLAGGLAHDFNNLLTGILGNVSFAKYLLDPDHKAYARLTAAENATEKATHLTQQLLTFAKGGKPVKSIAAINEIAAEAVGFALSGSKVDCAYKVPGDLWCTDVDAGQMTQVFNNLTLNAVYAMPDGGQLSVEFDNVCLEENQVPGLPAGDYVNIRFKDNGSGIRKELLPKIFDPYFTTKKLGSGLGLATVYSIIQRHEGYITVQSLVGKGTTFYIYLPASRTTASQKDAAEGTAAAGSGRVLVMDDEPMIRDLVGEMLTSLGYDVRCAEDGEKALSMYREALESKTPFTLVIMDLTIPGGMGGKEAVGKIIEIDPGAKVMVSSGYSTDPIMSEYKKYGFSGVVTKPYTMSRLSEAITRVSG